MQFKENTDSNKRSVYSDPLLARISISRVQPPSYPSFTLSRPCKIPYPILSRLSLERNNCSRTMHLLEALHVRQHDANRNKNAAKRRRTKKRKREGREKEGEREGARERETFPHLRQTFVRLLIQEFFSEAFESQDSEVSLIDAPCLFQNI